MNWSFRLLRNSQHLTSSMAIHLIWIVAFDMEVFFPHSKDDANTVSLWESQHDSQAGMYHMFRQTVTLKSVIIILMNWAKDITFGIQLI